MHMHTGESEEEEPQEPRNRTEFYRLFNQKGPTVMVAGFMADKSVKLIAHIIVDITFPLESSYYDTLQRVSRGWSSQAQWVSGRAVGEWLRTVTGILSVLESDQLHDHLELSRNMRLANIPAEDDWPVWALQEKDVLDQAFNFAVALAENWLWANIHFWFEFPSLVASLLHDDEMIVDMAWEHMQTLAKAVNTAEKVQRPSVKQLMSDLGWHREQLARDAMALTLQGQKQELVSLAKRLFMGTPSTKDVLENAFAFLHRKAQLHATNLKMSDMCKYLYCITNPYAESGGVPQILPSKSDMDSMNAPQGFMARQQAHTALFSPQKSLFPNPKAVPKPGRRSKMRNLP